MFTTLKNKLIEEVKASPSKFQQLANAAQAAVSSTSTTPSGSESNVTTPNENVFFSITEEDTPQNSPYKPLKLPSGGARDRITGPQSMNNGTGGSSGVGGGGYGGAMPRTRRLSNSSMASDVSFRLPSYDSPAVYHLQSDWDASGSEMGDETASTAKLDIITKEQLYDAYKKSLDRYHKYRCRYTDLAKKYKDLERDSTKARSVLVETQDKALRRISELREQCALEQQAKAHLEEQLRMEMDDMQCQMQAYQTKLQLLGETPDSSMQQVSAQLIDLSASNNQADGGINSGDTGDKSVDDSHDAKLATLAEVLKERELQLQELNEKYTTATATIELLRKQEEENALLLAQTKQAIYSELENKETEVNQLKDSIKQMQIELNAANKKETKLSGQAEEVKELMEKLKQANAAKQESDAKLIATEHSFSQLKSENSTTADALKAVEDRLGVATKEWEQKLQDLRQQNTQLNEMVQRYQQNEVSLAEIDNELNRTKNENDNLRATIASNEKSLAELADELAKQQQLLAATSQAQQAAEQRAADDQMRAQQLAEQLAVANGMLEQQKQRTDQLEAEIRVLGEQNASTAANDALTALHAELKQSTAEHVTQLQALREQLAAKEKELKASNNKFTKQKAKYDAQQAKSGEQSEELDRLRGELNRHEAHLMALQREAQEREKQTEGEKYELKAQITQILQEIAQMEEQMSVVQRSHGDLEAEKRALEAKIEHMQQQQQQEADAGLQHIEAQRKALEAKLQAVESEHSQLAESNCLLKESVQRFEKQLGERDRELSAQNAEMASNSEMRLKLATAEDTIAKLNEKMSQILDENSRMQNAQELMDHDHRSLQDKCDALEKEKAHADDAQQCLSVELAQLREAKAELELQMEDVRRKHDDATERATQLSELTQRTEGEIQSLTVELNALRSHAQADDDKLHVTLQERQQRIDELEAELSAVERRVLEVASEQDGNASKSAEALEHANEELALLREQNDSLNDEVVQLREASRQVQSEAVQRLQTQLEQLQVAHQEQIVELEKSAAEQGLAADEALGRLQVANADVERLHESNDALQVQMDKAKSNHELQMQELQQTLQHLQTEHAALKVQHKATAQHASMLANYEQVQIENEFLQTQAKQLIEEVSSLKAAADEQTKDAAEQREKLKSLQCELYVLQENAEAHGVERRAKEQQLLQQIEELQTLKATLSNERVEHERQCEHAKFITDQHDAVQKDLLATQHQLAELQTKLTQTQTTAAASERQVESVRAESVVQRETIEGLEHQLQALQIELAERPAMQQVEHSTTLTEQNAANNNNNVSKSSGDAQHLRDLNATLQRELEDLKQKSNAEISSLQQQIEDLQNNSKHMMDRMMEMESIRAGLQAQKLFANATTTTTNPTTSTTEPSSATAIGGSSDVAQGEKEELEGKLKVIMSEVQEVSNRNLFLEQKCENYLILEQSNERLKLQNAKLSRQLDETLVSMQHNDGITANTEFEYLKNIMFQYLTGSANGTNETLVRVISAVLKFSPQQTQVALEKEHQRRSLINKIL